MRVQHDGNVLVGNALGTSRFDERGSCEGAESARIFRENDPPPKCRDRNRRVSEEVFLF